MSKKETRLLSEFLVLAKNAERYAGELSGSGKTGLTKSSLHTLLNNLEQKGLLESRLDKIKIEGCVIESPRRYYKLSPFGEGFRNS